MYKTIHLLGLFLLLPLLTLAQKETKDTRPSYRVEAMDYARPGVDMINDGKYEEAIEIFTKAKEIDPYYYIYDYEIALAYHFQDKYSESIKVLENTIERLDTLHPQLYQLLGNGYDMKDQHKKALKVYDEGLKLFPDFGGLYYEKGIIYYNRERDVKKAVLTWEEGVEASPAYPSNYYMLANMFCNTNDELWGLIYGEIFMNLEPGSKRTEEISQLLYATYVQAIEIKSKKKIGISFVQNQAIPMPDGSGKMQLPFSMKYEMAMSAAAAIVVAEEKKLKVMKLSHLHALRVNFLEVFQKNGGEDLKSHILFDWHNQLKEKGLFEVYDYWLFQMGEGEAATQFINDNPKKYQQLGDVLLDSPLIPTKENYFLRTKL